MLKRSANGGLVLLRDVGKAELGAEDYSLNLRFDGRDAVGLGVFQQPNANALQLEAAVRATLSRLAVNFPPSMKYEIAFNPTTAVRESIREVVKTLLEAIVLVIVVIFLFLQDWRATVIPAVTIPVSLIGTFAFIKAFGFSINTLTLFGIVLATGLVVDDAIVVVENIARNLGETRGDAHAAAQPGDGRGGGRGDRHLAGADRGVRAGRVSLRHDRAPLSTVLADHRVLRRHLGVQRADAVARAGRPPAAPRAGASLRALPLVQPGVRRHPRALPRTRSRGSCTISAGWAPPSSAAWP